MAKSNAKAERIKVALNEATYEKLKTFSRAHGLKLRTVIDVMTDHYLNDPALSEQLIAQASQPTADEQ
jgi:hypothetical protein